MKGGKNSSVKHHSRTKLREGFWRRRERNGMGKGRWAPRALALTK